MKKLHGICVMAIVLISCQSSEQTASLKDITSVIEATCYEIVTPKVNNDQISYTMKMPVLRLSRVEREDEYHSIGTAFAIAPQRFITAAHVLEPMMDYMFMKEYYIRSEKGEVHRIKDLIRFDTVRDVAEFTTDPPFESAYLQLRSKKYRRNETVYQVGNVYGDGVVAVVGTVAGMERNNVVGEWSSIKSSPPVDSGASGGPLLDANNQVLGIILARNDTFTYSRPIEAITDLAEGIGLMEASYTTVFPNLAEQEYYGSFTEELPLPMSLGEIKKTLQARSDKFQISLQEELFRQVGGLFPHSDGSDQVLQEICVSDGIQYVYRDIDNEWYYSDLDKTSVSLPGGGRWDYSGMPGEELIMCFDLHKPADTTHGRLYDSSREIMDLMISGDATYRYFDNFKLRIASLGEPFRQETYRDDHGRIWRIALWNKSYNPFDEVIILVWIPLPYGLSGLMYTVESPQVQTALVSLRNIVNLVYVPYLAYLDEWRGYLSHALGREGPYGDMILDYRDQADMSIDSEEISLTLNSDLFTVEDLMTLGLYRNFYRKDGKVIWGLRKVMVNEYHHQINLSAIFRKQPDDDAPEKFHQEWEDFRNRRHPYNSQFFHMDEVSGIGAPHPQFFSDDTEGFSLFLWVEGLQTQEFMEENLAVIGRALQY